MYHGLINLVETSSYFQQHYLAEGDWDYNVYEEYVTFSRQFTTMPDIQVVMKNARMYMDGEEDGYGWSFETSSVSQSGFNLKMIQWDRYFYNEDAAWIACS